MAFIDLHNVRIAGFSAGVPSNVVRSDEMKGISSEYSSDAFAKETGVKEKRYSDKLTASDLCFAAAERLIADLDWNRDEIDGVIFVSQFPDYILPASSCMLQDRLHLKKDCYALDISRGCSGWVYGMSTAASLVQTGCLKKVLLLCGDGCRVAEQDVDPLMACAGTATALVYDETASPLHFNFGTDGSGYDAIIIPDGGARNQITEQSLVKEPFEGRMIHRLQSRMKGMDVFAFGISTAPKSIKKLAGHIGIDYLKADRVVFHQANMKMLGVIKKKLQLTDDQMPTCMSEYGNTSSASIPLTIVTRVKDRANLPTTFICCGFGVGLSWGTLYFESQSMVISDIVSVDE